MTVITTIEDLRQLAKKRVPRMFYDYADSGSWTETTYRANSEDFQRIKLRQRVAVNMENRSTAVTMVGQLAKMPVAIAPVGLTGMQHADGEIHAARAAQKFDGQQAGVALVHVVLAQIRVPERLEHAHPADAEDRLLLGGEHDDRHLAKSLGGAKLPDEFKPVDGRHHEILQNHGRFDLGRDLEGGGCVAAEMKGDALLADEHAANRLTDDRLVIDEQHRRATR